MGGMAALLLIHADGVRPCACVRAPEALAAGALCVAEAAGRQRFCVVRAAFPEGRAAPAPTPGWTFARAATADDAGRRATNAQLAEAAMKAFDAETAGAPQKPYAIGAAFDAPRRHLRLVFHADRPFDTRRVAASLRRRFGAEVEARQAGIRDEVAALGAIGPCGCPVCCARALVPSGAGGVNVRMAKRQNVALTPANLNGYCGRLKCCLGFEDAGGPAEGAEPGEDGEKKG